jgi:hypothetical protein
MWRTWGWCLCCPNHDAWACHLGGFAKTNHLACAPLLVKTTICREPFVFRGTSVVGAQMIVCLVPVAVKNGSIRVMPATNICTRFITQRPCQWILQRCHWLPWKYMEMVAWAESDCNGARCDFYYGYAKRLTWALWKSSKRALPLNRLLTM